MTGQPQFPPSHWELRLAAAPQPLANLALTGLPDSESARGGWDVAALGLGWVSPGSQSGPQAGRGWEMMDLAAAAPQDGPQVTTGWEEEAVTAVPPESEVREGRGLLMTVPAGVGAGRGACRSR